MVNARAIHHRRDRAHLYRVISLSIADAARKEAVLGLTSERVHLMADADLNGQKPVDLESGKVSGTSYIASGRPTATSAVQSCLSENTFGSCIS